MLPAAPPATPTSRASRSRPPLNRHNERKLLTALHQTPPGHFMTDRQIDWTTFHPGVGAAGKVLVDPQLKLDRNLYHRLSWQWAKQIFKHERLRLGPVRNWDDLYERWWCDGLFGRGTRLQGLNAYAMCWTKTKFDEPAWRMVAASPRPIVRLTCPVRALLNAAKACDPTVYTGRWFLGVVRYRRTDELYELACNVQGGLLKEVSSTAAAMLMYKRNAFRFEKEVRLLYLERGAPKDEVFLPLAKSAGVLEVMSSPYATAREISDLRSQSKSYGFGFKRSKVLEAPAWPK